MLFFRTDPAQPGSKKGMSFRNDSDLDTVAELESAVDDLSAALDGASGSGFEEKQKRSLIAVSNADSYDDAKMEWALKKQWAESNGKCELCGHNPIVYHFQIENKLNHHTMVLGSSCILTYVVLSGFTKQELNIYLNRLRARLQDRRFDAVDATTLDVWDRQDAIFASLKTLQADLPNGFDIGEFQAKLATFRRVAGFQLSDSFAKWVRNVSVMRRVMEDTYRTTLVKEIPDKIRRKQKIDRVKVSDEKKLQLFVEYETQLRLLLQYGTPTQAYDLILREYRNFIQGQIDDLEDKQSDVEGDVISHFATMKKEVGNRTRLKGYIDEWKEATIHIVDEQYSDYEARLTNIDAMLTNSGGRRHNLTAPSTDANVFIRQWTYGDWISRNPGHAQLYNMLKCSSWDYRPASSWSSSVPPDHPIRKVTTISSVDLKAAVFSTIDAGDIKLSDLTRLGLSATYQRCSVPAEALVRNGDLLNRLMGSSDAFRDAIADARAAQQQQTKADDDAAKLEAKRAAAAEQQDIRDLQEYKDLVAEADRLKDPSAQREVQFVEDMQRRYKRIKDLSPGQLRWLRGISSRSVVPTAPASASSAAPVAAPGSFTKTPTNGRMTLDEFFTSCTQTMRAGSEAGFINSLVKRRRVKNWDDLSDRQKKWLTDIYTRGNKRDMPTDIRRR